MNGEICKIFANLQNCLPQSTLQKQLFCSHNTSLVDAGTKHTAKAAVLLQFEVKSLIKLDEPQYR